MPGLIGSQDILLISVCNAFCALFIHESPLHWHFIRFLRLRATLRLPWVTLGWDHPAQPEVQHKIKRFKGSFLSIQIDPPHSRKPDCVDYVSGCPFLRQQKAGFEISYYAPWPRTNLLGRGKPSVSSFREMKIRIGSKTSNHWRAFSENDSNMPVIEFLCTVKQSNKQNPSNLFSTLCKPWISSQINSSLIHSSPDTSS